MNPNGEQITVDVTELTAGSLDASSVALVYDIGAGFTSVPMTQGAPGSPSRLPCRRSLRLGRGLVHHREHQRRRGDDPALRGALGPFQSVAALGEIVVDSNDMQTAAGWTVGAPGDNATTGVWTRGNPIGTDAQPENDNSPIGALLVHRPGRTAEASVRTTSTVVARPS